MRLLLPIAFLLCVGALFAASKMQAPELKDQMVPVQGNWPEYYDANDLEVIQTYNIALLRAALREQIVEVNKIKKTLAKWSIVDDTETAEYRNGVGENEPKTN